MGTRFSIVTRLSIVPRLSMNTRLEVSIRMSLVSRSNNRPVYFYKPSRICARAEQTVAVAPWQARTRVLASAHGSPWPSFLLFKLPLPAPTRERRVCTSSPRGTGPGRPRATAARPTGIKKSARQVRRQNVRSALGTT